MASRIGTQAGLNDGMNFDNVFIRCVTIAMMSTMRERISWINSFDTGDVEFVLPFMFKMVGQERFLRDLFEDDIPRRRVELNTDVVPRAVLEYKSLSIKLEEVANPYVHIPNVIVEKGVKKQAYSRVRPIPVELSYTLEVKLQSEIDTFKFVQKAAEVFFYWNSFNFDYNGVQCEGIFFFPENPTTDTPKEIKIDSLDNFTSVMELSVKTMIPILTDTKYYNTGRIKTWDLSILGKSNLTGPSTI